MKSTLSSLVCMQILLLQLWASSQPSNDDCEDAILLDTAVQVQGTSVGAFGIDLSTCAGEDFRDVWYSWIPEVSGTAVVQVIWGDFPSSKALSIIDGCGGLELACVITGRSGNAVELPIEVQQGVEYLFRIAGSAGSVGTFSIVVTFEGPPNDECDNAEKILTGVVQSGNNAGASGLDMAPCGQNDFNDVWFYWVPESSDMATISTCGSHEFDTTLAVFESCDASIPIACDDDTCGTGSSVTMSVTAETEYFIRVAGFNGESGSFELLATLGSGGEGEGEQAPSLAEAQILVSEFAQADSDDDGRLSQNEAAAFLASFSAANFHALDTNMDGTLSLQELNAFIDSQTPDVPGGCAAAKKYIGKSLAEYFGDSLIILLVAATSTLWKRSFYQC